MLHAAQTQGLSPERGAGRIEAERDFALDVIDTLVTRVQRAVDEDSADRARQRLLNRLDQRAKRRKHLADLRKSLVYERATDEARHGQLMISAENARALPDTKDSAPFVVVNSMREVQPEINLLVSPIKENLVYNTHSFRTDLACFEHVKCHGRTGDRKRNGARRSAVPARYLLACVNGHLDEFPYELWVHHGKPCAEAELPELRMVDRTAGKGASAVIHCASCEQRRPMNEAQGEAGKLKLPKCRGRHPHLDAFEPGGCGLDTRLILVGASNLWFPATQSIIVMPESPQNPEDFLHGAACHCCVMASETSCERANRFLDRRFLVGLPGCNLGFFGPRD